jgi:hypothetical protein
MRGVSAMQLHIRMKIIVNNCKEAMAGVGCAATLISLHQRRKGCRRKVDDAGCVTDAPLPPDEVFTQMFSVLFITKKLLSAKFLASFCYGLNHFHFLHCLSVVILGVLAPHTLSPSFACR